MDQREVLLQVVVAMGNVEAAGCSIANAMDSSKKVDVSEGVAVETGSYLKVVGCKIAQTH